MNFEEIDWEQRRYELTRAALEGLSANWKDESIDDITEIAIDTAEATLSLLMDKAIAGLWATANKPMQDGRKPICIWNDQPVKDEQREGSWTDCDEHNLLSLEDNRPFPFLRYEDGPVRLDDIAKLRERRQQKEEWKPCGDTEELRRNKIRTAAYDSMQTAVCDLIPPKSLRVTLRQFWSAWKKQMTLCDYSDAELYQKTQYVTGFQHGAEWADKNPKYKL